MNYTPLNEAYKIHHTNNKSYNNNVQPQYDPKCIFCSSVDTVALMLLQDGGFFRRCINRSCRKDFRAQIQSTPVTNYIHATSHLKGTN
jgi:hypothetical protein